MTDVTPRLTKSWIGLHLCLHGAGQQATPFLLHNQGKGNKQNCTGRQLIGSFIGPLCSLQAYNTRHHCRCGIGQRGNKLFPVTRGRGNATLNGREAGVPAVGFNTRRSCPCNATTANAVAKASWVFFFFLMLQNHAFFEIPNTLPFQNIQLPPPSQSENKYVITEKKPAYKHSS